VRAVNLLPASRLDALRRRIRVRAWSGIIGGFGVVLGLTYFIAQFAWYYDRPELEQAVDEAVSKNKAISSDVVRLRDRVRAASEQLHATRAIGNLPDWSVLLAAIDRATGDYIVLDRVAVASETTQVPSPPDTKAAAKTLVTTSVSLSGIGTNASRVSEFSLRLEETDLFLEVEIVGGKRRNDGHNEFSMICRLLEELR